MNGALLQARLLEKKARIEAVKARVIAFQQHNATSATQYGEESFLQCESELETLANEVKALGDEYAKYKGWA